MFNKDGKKKKGFTLIELVIAVLIIGVIAAIAVPMYFKAVEKSRASESINLLGTIAKAEQRHKLQSQEYTDQVEDLDITLKNYTDDTAASGSNFDTEFFDFTLGTQNAQSARKEGDYTISINYDTNEITCDPSDNSICIAFGLNGSGNASSSNTEDVQEETVDPWRETSCVNGISPMTLPYNSSDPASLIFDTTMRTMNTTYNYDYWDAENSQECMYDGDGNLIKFRQSYCDDPDIPYCETTEFTDYGYNKSACTLDENNECEEYNRREELVGSQDKNSYVLKYCEYSNMNQEDGSCLQYDGLYIVDKDNWARCISFNAQGECQDWEIYDNDIGVTCHSGEYMVGGLSPEQLEALRATPSTHCSSNHPCATNPGGTECCMHNPNYPGCGSPDDPCVIAPGSSKCCRYHANSLNMPECDWYNQTNNPCITNPGGTACCQREPSRPECLSIDPCMAYPGSTACCNKEPSNPSCMPQPSDACSFDPGGRACCDSNPSYPGCEKYDPCYTYPGSSICCNSNPNDASCNTPGISDPCVNYGVSSECCSSNPAYPGCEMYSSSDPCMYNPSSKDCCQREPNRPECEGTVTYCDMYPMSPECCETKPETAPECDWYRMYKQQSEMRNNPCTKNPSGAECCAYLREQNLDMTGVDCSWYICGYLGICND